MQRLAPRLASASSKELTALPTALLIVTAPTLCLLPAPAQQLAPHLAFASPKELTALATTHSASATLCTLSMFPTRTNAAHALALLLCSRNRWHPAL